MKLQVKKQNIKKLYQKYHYWHSSKTSGSYLAIQSFQCFYLFLAYVQEVVTVSYPQLIIFQIPLNTLPSKLVLLAQFMLLAVVQLNLFFSVLIFKRRDQKNVLFNYCLKALQVILIAALIIFCIFIEKLDFNTMMIVAAILGIGYQGMVPFGLEILEEIGEMDNQLISNSYAFFGSLLSVTGSTLIDMKAFKFYGIYFLILFEIPALIVLMFFYNQSMNKREISTTNSVTDEQTEQP
eukprot:TRINITY_DN2232_c0_g4_i1.p1 TRINITY_DN2232_c0_g4~~TRINITY_DN2232_c0_g4_i1.p1  ORF type:complete len:237 (+),score=18.29 TRINITY_DN2232_c0_g4_i1:230-940(+)